MARRAFCQAMLEQHIYFFGLSHCAFRNGSNLSSAWWLWKSLLSVFFWIWGFFFFSSLSKRNIMTSTCPPLPLQHILSEVLILAENVVSPSCSGPASCSQRALRVPLPREVPRSRAACSRLCPPGDCELLDTGTLQHLSNPHSLVHRKWKNELTSEKVCFVCL